MKFSLALFFTLNVYERLQVEVQKEKNTKL